MRSKYNISTTLLRNNVNNYNVAAFNNLIAATQVVFNRRNYKKLSMYRSHFNLLEISLLLLFDNKLT